MLLFPAIDLYEGKAVRLFKGDYNQMTVYSSEPLTVAEDFVSCGMRHIHLVDLEGARDGETPNLETVLKIKKSTGLFCEIGGGIRSMHVIDRYLSAGLDRVILGTAAVTDEKLLLDAVDKYGDKIAVGMDILNGNVAIKGWRENTSVKAEDFMRKLRGIGVKYVICTDISRDGAMQGTNRGLYQKLSQEFDIHITASGGVNGLDDIVALNQMNLYAAIIGQAYYTGSLDLRKAQEAIQ